MTASASPDVLEAVLDHLAGSFRLDHEIGGRSLRSLLVETVRDLGGDDTPVWGKDGPTRHLVRVGDGALTFAYRPHLFPGMSADLRLGHEVQFHLLPRSLPAGAPVEIAAVLESYCHLSGDLFGWREEPNGRFTVWMLDVSGHGVRAGFAAVVIKLLIAESDPGLPLPHLATWIEERFLAARNPTDHGCLYATGLFISIDADGRVEYVSAGHPPFVVCRAGRDVRWFDATGVPIALLPGRPPAARTLELAPDDIVVMYTDGLTDARTPAGSSIGTAPLVTVLETIGGPPHVVAARLLDAFEEALDLERLDDDVSFLVIGRRTPRVS